MAVAVQAPPKFIPKPRLRLVDPETGKKIRLSLRKMDFTKELSKVPKNPLKNHEAIISCRGDQNAATYNMVLNWKQLCRSGDYWWKNFGCNTEAEYLAYYGLPDGSTLGHWAVMVQTFDRATFVLLGPEVLAFMMRLVSEHQKNADTQKLDYQAIFDRYSKAHESFDRTDFCDTVRQYIAEQYAWQIREREGRREEERRGRERAVATSSPTAATVATPANGETTEAMFVATTLAVEQLNDGRIAALASPAACTECARKEEILAEFDRYVSNLEGIISTRLSPKALPYKPKVLQQKFR